MPRESPPGSFPNVGLNYDYEYKKTLHLQTGRYDIEVRYDDYERSVYLQFARDGQISPRSNRSHQEISQGRHDLLIVMREITNALHHILGIKPVHSIQFHGAATEGGRIELYQHFAQSLAARYHGEAKWFPTGSYVHFIIRIGAAYDD